MPWSVVALAVGAEVGKRNKKESVSPSKRKGSFDSYEIPQDRTGRLNDQCKFFGFKSKRFISMYAKKPRILIKPKTIRIQLNKSEVREYIRDQGNAALLANMQARGDSALYQQQMDRGIQNSMLGHNQMCNAQAQQALIGGLCGIDDIGGGNIQSQLIGQTNARGIY